MLEDPADQLVRRPKRLPAEPCAGLAHDRSPLLARLRLLEQMNYAFFYVEAFDAAIGDVIDGCLQRLIGSGLGCDVFEYLELVKGPPKAFVLGGCIPVTFSESQQGVISVALV